MSTNVVMPQMGESVAEGTVTRWIKKVGDTIERDEPLFEISTDKVDAEIPSPAAGVLVEVRVKEGETVPVDTVVALIAPPGTPVTPPSTTATAPAAAAAPAPSGADAGAVSQGNGVGAAHDETPADDDRDAVRRTKSSPLVRRIAEEHDVDVAAVAGTGIGGRVTKKDILDHIATRGAAPAQPTRQAPASTAPVQHVPSYKPGERVDVVPMTVMRRKIAEHMILSKKTSAHVHSVFEFDYTNVLKIRQAKKAEYEANGAKLTVMAFICKAVIDGLRAVPIMNSSVDGDNIVYRKDINLGIAVALEQGLIVPVVRNADEKNLLGLARSIADLASRARSKQLKPEEVAGGTFTITNPGVFGTLFGMPIISQPQVAILGVGAIEKRVVVTDDDAIAIRSKAYMSIGYDHRVVDGATADEFMSVVKKSIETWDPANA